MKGIFFLFFLVFTLFLSAQNKYWIFLKDKDISTFNPYSYFDAKAIDRRLKNDIPIFSVSDAPVNENYLREIALSVDSVKFASRWFNAVCVFANEDAINNLRSKKYIAKIEKVENSVCNFASVVDEDNLSDVISDSEIMKGQISSMQGKLFYNAGYRGKGVRIAIFDGGFPNVDKLDCFKHIREKNNIVKTFDFTKGKEYVYRGSSHGTMVMSCVGGIYNDSLVGLATDAEYLLAITEINTEPFSEEENWLAALEWADKNGADIINSSLGYTYHRYFPYQMDGKTAFVSCAASMAASKGILVVNAAGNEGDENWKYIGAPADADSIISVGGVDPSTNLHISFSSYGPTADGRLKPNVSAFGNVIVCGKNGMKNCYGTSFASPLVAGFAACVLQTNPQMKTMDLYNKIQKSASLYPYYDYSMGYGIPQASYFLNIERGKTKTSVVFEKNNAIEDNEIVISVIFSEGNYFYYHLSDASGKIKWYNVDKCFEDTFNVVINLDYLEDGDVLRAYCNGSYNEFKYVKK